MASKAHISIVRVTGLESSDGKFIGIEDSDNVGEGELIVPTGTSQATTLTVTAFGSGDSPGRYACCVANLGDTHLLWTEGEGTPEASAAVGKPVPAGTVRHFRCKAFGNKFAVVNA